MAPSTEIEVEHVFDSIDEALAHSNVDRSTVETFGSAETSLGQLLKSIKTPPKSVFDSMRPTGQQSTIQSGAQSPSLPPKDRPKRPTLKRS